MNHPTSIRLSPDEQRKLARLAELAERSKSDVLKILIRRAHENPKILERKDWGDTDER